MSAPARIFLVAAERSGDMLGTELMRAMRARLGAAVEFAGVGGAAMAAEGMPPLFDISDLSILGLFDGLKVYGRVLRRVEETIAAAEAFRPDAAVLIDSWGFSIRVAKALKARLPDVKVVKYVGPQVWASRPERARALARVTDRLLTIHSFDAPYFEREGLPTVFVGNPALEREGRGDRPGFRKRHGLSPDDEALLVLFGSRSSELRRLYEPFADAVKRLRGARPGLRVIVPLAGSIEDAARAKIAADTRFDGAVVVGEDEKASAFAAGDAALACSGTVVTELSLAGVPSVAAYRVGWVTWTVARALFLLRTRYISLVNIAAGRELVPEYVQTRCTGANLARAAGAILSDPDGREETARLLRAITTEMRGEGRAADKAAEAVIALLARPGQRLDSGT
ncbi:MAG: lipid-A-disaccharide synthase [Maricaulaceae bacterium]|nr:lipid-A-disaccharide synthase [Maricaulaceae bacterium]